MGIYIFQKDYYKIRVGQGQPGRDLRQYHILAFSLFSVRAQFLSKSDRCKLYYRENDSGNAVSVNYRGKTVKIT